MQPWFDPSGARDSPADFVPTPLPGRRAEVSEARYRKELINTLDLTLQHGGGEAPSPAAEWLLDHVLSVAGAAHVFAGS
jgi:hypothetical protein